MRRPDFLVAIALLRRGSVRDGSPRTDGTSFLVNQGSRRRFVAEQRVAAQRHFDETADVHDTRFGDIDPTHQVCVRELLSAMSPDEELLDAACGTGRLFGVVTSTGRPMLGIDQSVEMLARAHEKWPSVPTRHLALQDLRDALDLRNRFGGLMCVDAMEWVLRDDWPVVLDGFKSVVKPNSPVYLNVEIPGEHEQVELALPTADGAESGEILVHGNLNHFPDANSVLRWIGDAGFRVVSERTGDYYWHLILRAES